jgi:hypothetical protein
MDRRVRKLGTVLLGCALATGITASPAAASGDTTPPRLTMAPYAAFIQGGPISASDPLGNDSFVGSIPMQISWSASDASGICGYDVWEDYAGTAPNVLLVGTRAKSYSGSLTDYDDQYGGGSGKTEDWGVVAHDCAGNASGTAWAAVRPTVTQEDGYSPDYPLATISYTGLWSKTTCSCFSAGSDQRTSAKGATASIRFDARANSTVGIVMPKAPNRGKFTVFVDGVNRGTVDTYAASSFNRIIVWAGRVSTSGTHVIKMVNQATAGRPRIDLDAVLLNS